MELKGEACEMSVPLPAASEDACASRPVAFPRYALQVRFIPTKMVFARRSGLSVGKITWGGFIVRQLPKWSLGYCFSDLRGVFYTERSLLKILCVVAGN